MTTKLYQGGCLCGAVRYEFSGEPVHFYHCHCQRCRKASGSGHATNLFIKPEQIRWIRGEELLARYKVPDAERFTNTFCSRCGSRMPRVVPHARIVMIPAGSLDTDPGMQPEARIFWDSRAQWSCADEALPVYGEYATD
jgi:hypothetical protein